MENLINELIVFGYAYPMIWAVIVIAGIAILLGIVKGVIYLMKNSMKKPMILSVLLTVVAMSVNAQTINDIPIEDIDVEFVQIVGTAKMMNPNKVTIAVNFGQENKVFSGKDDGIVKDEIGKKVVFFTMIDALNFMSANGYDFVDAYTVTIGQANVYHYLLKKRK